MSLVCYDPLIFFLSMKGLSRITYPNKAVGDDWWVIRLVSVIAWLYLNLDHVTSAFSLSFDHQRFNSSL
jgi:hypothetical protein